MRRMGLFKKKADPISERSKALKAEIAALESKIQKLTVQTEQKSKLPDGFHEPPAAAPEPIFEEVNQARLQTPPETLGPEHFNEMGVRKFDLAAWMRRLQNMLRGRSAANPKLVTFLAAGSIQGLRPLRYEKRVARNRLIFWCVILFVVLWGLVGIFLKQR